MGTGAAAGGSESTDRRAFGDFAAYPNQDGRQMAVSRAHAIAVVDLDHVAVAAPGAGENHGAGCGGSHGRAPWPAEIQSGMERDMTRERIDAGAKSACFLEARAMNRRGQGNMAETGKERVEFKTVGAGSGIGSREGRIGDAVDLTVFHRDERTADALATALERVGIHTHAVQQALQIGNAGRDLLIHALQQRGFRAAHTTDALSLRGQDAKGGIAKNRSRGRWRLLLRLAEECAGKLADRFVEEARAGGASSARLGGDRLRRQLGTAAVIGVAAAADRRSRATGQERSRPRPAPDAG